MKDRKLKLLSFATSQLLFLLLVASLFAMDNIDIAAYQKEISGRPVGERIALWAEKFIGTPYDPDPLGEYVTKKVIIADDRVDCMYLSFRAVELAMSNTPEDAVAIALDRRFRGKGSIKNGLVVNYEDRFQYGEDMLYSGKWGRDITPELGKMMYIKGSRWKEKAAMISKKDIKRGEAAVSVLKSGDMIFFVKSPSKRLFDEIIGHIGIIKKEGDTLYLIHAGGIKSKGGAVKKVLFRDYVEAMPFVGIMAGRID